MPYQINYHHQYHQQSEGGSLAMYIYIILAFNALFPLGLLQSFADCFNWNFFNKFYKNIWMLSQNTYRWFPFFNPFVTQSWEQQKFAWTFTTSPRLVYDVRFHLAFLGLCCFPPCLSHFASSSSLKTPTTLELELCRILFAFRCIGQPGTWTIPQWNWGLRKRCSTPQHDFFKFLFFSRVVIRWHFRRRNRHFLACAKDSNTRIQVCHLHGVWVVFFDNQFI